MIQSAFRQRLALAEGEKLRAQEEAVAAAGGRGRFASRKEMVRRMRKCHVMEAWEALPDTAASAARRVRARIWVRAARGLPNADAKGLSDAYCRVLLDGKVGWCVCVRGRAR